MILRFTATDFRCLEKVQLELSPTFNLIYGANASGKTSLLEALAYLGRGKSFRGAPPPGLARHGSAGFVLFGEVEVHERRHRLGVSNGREGLAVRVDGASDAGLAELALLLPLQVVDPEVHNLVAGGPEQRRRYLDWIAFHVEHGYLDTWRRFRRVLRQRNAALRSKAGPATIRSWDAEFVAVSEMLNVSRRRALDAVRDDLEAYGQALLDTGPGFEYYQGWSREAELGPLLEDSLDRDVQQGATQLGPHRADLRISYDERQARKLVSRGQQKLLAGAMVLAATATVQAALERPLLLLLDDPAAELDGGSLERLMTAVAGLGSQVVATSLDRSALVTPAGAAVFHVEHGNLQRVGEG